MSIGNGNKWRELLLQVPNTNSLASFVENVTFFARQLAFDGLGAGLRRTIGQGLFQAYKRGFHGCFVDRDPNPKWARAIAGFAKDRFRNTVGASQWQVEQVMPTALQGTGRGKRALNWQYIQKVNPRFLAGSQDYGNCRSWSAREASMVLAGLAIAKGGLHRLDYRHGTALVYGSRGSSSQGMDMATGCEVLTTIGQSEEKDYGGGLDLSTEDLDESRGNAWGRSGPPAALIAAVKGDVVQKAYNIGEATADMVMDIFWNEGVIDHGSNSTAGQSRNGLISPLESIGGHAQCGIGYDDTDEFKAWAKQNLNITLTDAVVISDQSWGDWLDLPKWPTELWGSRPEGAWVVTMTDFLKICNQWGDGWAMTGINGFQARSLPNWGTSTYLGD